MNKQKSRPIVFGSLFSGIGGLDLGLERAGWVCKFQVEIDSWCRKQLYRHWPMVHRFRDVRTFLDDPKFKENNLHEIDALVGGFPCQDVSEAGEKHGIIKDKTRSGLWFYYLASICALRPRIVVVENVPGLLHRGLGTVLAGLATAGYDAEWDCLSAFQFGAPQRRKRVLLVAYPRGTRLAGPVFPLGWNQDSSERKETTNINRNGSSRHSVRAGLSGSDSQQRVCGIQGTSSTIIGHTSFSCWGWWRKNSTNIRMGNGVPISLAKPIVKAYGNAVVPQVAEFIGRRISEVIR